MSASPALTSLPVFLINLDHRRDRLESSTAELLAAGFAADEIRRVRAVPTPANGAIGCAKSHCLALLSFLAETASQFCLVVEDDFQLAVPAGEFRPRLASGLSLLPGVDLLLLAHNQLLSITEPGLPGIVRVFSAQTTSAYVVARRFVPELLKCFSESALILERFPRETDRRVVAAFAACDMRWRHLHAVSDVYAFEPRLSRQCDSWSDIEQRTVNYGV